MTQNMKDLLEARMDRSFRALENVPPDSDFVRCLVDDWARCVDVSADVAPWAFDLFLETVIVFRELIGSDSASDQQD